jgi:hypothetical protein
MTNTNLIGLLDTFPEINPANYGDDDVNALNAWGIAAHKALEAQAKQIEAFEGACVPLKDYADLALENNKLLEQIEALQADAERYRWLARKVSAHGICHGWQFGFPTALTLPANALAMRDPETSLGQCIDAAMQKDKL